MNTAFETELEKLLGESCESIESRERSAFNEAAGDRAEKLVLFGTGGLALRTLAGLRQVGIEPVAFSDNDSRKWNTTVEGIRVLPPEDAVRLWGDKAVFIVTIWSDRAGHPVSSIKRQLAAHGTVRVISFAPLYWKYASVFLPYFALDLPHQICAVAHRVRLAAQLWEDSLSQELYLAQLRGSSCPTPPTGSWITSRASCPCETSATCKRITRMRIGSWFMSSSRWVPNRINPSRRSKCSTR